MRILSNLLLLLAAIGLGLIASIDLYELMATDDPLVVLFTKAWWAGYGLVYLTLFALLALGASLAVATNRS